MPAVSAKQKKFMDAAAHNPAFAKKAGVPTKVAKEFSKASKGETFSKGGDMATKKLFGGKESMKEELAEAKAIKSGKISPMQYAKGEKSEPKMAKGGKVGSASKRADGIAQRGKTKGKLLNKGGMAKC
jgi:hypothetical protein